MPKSKSRAKGSAKKTVKRPPTRPTKPPHSGTIANPKTFMRAVRDVIANPGKIYHTVAGTPFTAGAHIAKRGKMNGKQVIVFKQRRKEMARAYKCCWGYKTNCNRAYIDSYTPVI